jgi:hypothetical protein
VRVYKEELKLRFTPIHTSLSQQKYYDATSLRRQAAIFNRCGNFNKCTLASYNSTATRLAIAFSLSGKYTERVCG